MPALSVAAALHAIGHLDVETLPGIATEALLAGNDSTALAALAGESLARYDADALRLAFVTGLRESGIVLPEKTEAVTLLLKHYVTAALDGALSPEEAGRIIVQQLYYGTDARSSDERVAGESLGISRLIGIYWDWRDSTEARTLTPELRSELVAAYDSALRELAKRL